MTRGVTWSSSPSVSRYERKVDKLPNVLEEGVVKPQIDMPQYTENLHAVNRGRRMSHESLEAEYGCHVGIFVNHGGNAHDCVHM
jgi:hypothetical protein